MFFWPDAAEAWKSEEDTVEKTALTTVREEPSPCRIKLNVEVSREGVTQAVQSAEKEFRRYARVPGFRPGKAPRALIHRHYGKQLMDEAKQRLLRTALADAIEQEGVQPDQGPPG